MFKKYCIILCMFSAFIISGLVSAQSLEVYFNGNRVHNGAEPDESIGTKWHLLSVDAQCEHIFTLKNTGSQDMSISDIVLTNNLGSSFIFPGLKPQTIAAGGQGFISVNLIPKSLQTYTATFEIRSNDPAGNFSVELEGFGDAIAPAKIVISHAGNRIYTRNDLREPSIAQGIFFANVVQGSTEDKTFTIKNEGTQELRLTAEPFIQTKDEMNGTVPPDPNFSLQSSTGSNIIPAGASKDFTIRYNPSSDGVHEVRFFIYSNTAEEPNRYYDNAFQLWLKGTSDTNNNAPELFVYEDITFSVFKYYDINFEGILPNDSKIKRFIIENHGDAPLSLTGVQPVTLSGADVADFSVTQQPPSTIAPGGSEFFEVTFSPSAVGNKKASLQIESNDSSSPYTKDIVGSCITSPPPPVAEMKLSYNGHYFKLNEKNAAIDLGTDFEDCSLGSQISHTLTIENTGGDVLTISDMHMNYYTDYSISSPAIPFDIAPGASQDFQVIFKPASIGVKDNLVVVQSKVANYYAVLSGNGIPAPESEIQVESGGYEIANNDTTPDLVNHTDFGAVKTGSSSSYSYSVSNIGQADLSLSGTPVVEISGTNAAAFTVKIQPGDTIVPGNSDSFTIEFAPSSDGLKTAQVAIANNDGDENPFTFAIQGVGAINLFSISGTVTGDIKSGVSVSVDAAHSALTDASGNYTITGLADGTYTVSPILSGYYFSPGNQVVTVSGGDKTGIDFTSASSGASVYKITGQITGDVQAGVTVAVDATHSATTDASGNYTIGGLADGSYTVTPTLGGYTFAPGTANATVAGSDITGINFVSTQNVAPKFALTVNNGTGLH